jgi:dGTPase
VYDDDLAVFAWFRQGREPGRRCIEADVMDWSDDVAYSAHDVEDAIASGRLDVRRLRDPGDVDAVLGVASGLYAPDLGTDALGAALERVLATGTVPTAYEGSRTDRAALKDMTSRLIGRFVVAVEGATREAHGGGDLTRYAAHLVVPDATRAECAVLKAVAAHFVMHAQERVEVLAGQREVVRDLVTAYQEDPVGRLDPDLLGDWKAAESDAAALRVVIDQVASLTDVRALALYARWS